MPYEELKSQKSPPDIINPKPPKRNVPHLRNRQEHRDDASDVAIRGPVYSDMGSDSDEDEDDMFNTKNYPQPFRINFQGKYGLQEEIDPMLQPQHEPLYNEQGNIPEEVNVVPGGQNGDGNQDVDLGSNDEDSIMQDDPNNITQIQRNVSSNGGIQSGSRIEAGDQDVAKQPKHNKSVTFGKGYYQSFNEEKSPNMFKKAIKYFSNRNDSPYYVEMARKAQQVTPRPILTSTPEGPSNHVSPGYSPITPKPVQLHGQKIRHNHSQNDQSATPQRSLQVKPKQLYNDSRNLSSSPAHGAHSPKSHDVTKLFPPSPERTVSAPYHERELVKPELKQNTNEQDHSWTTVNRHTRSKGRVKDYPLVMDHPIEHKKRVKRRNK